MKKIVALGIMSLFLMTSFALCINAMSNAYELKEMVTSDQDETYLITKSTRGSPPLPPVMWTEDFNTFYIPTPQNPDGDDVFYLIDWGDGTSSGWIGPYEPGETAFISHVWEDVGTYEIKVKAKDQDGESKCTTFSSIFTSETKFFGVKIGYMYITYKFTISWKDSNCYIMIDWGDGSPIEWLGPYNQPMLFSHKWSKSGIYVLKLRFKDIYGNISDWLYYTVKILNLDNNAPDKPIVNGPTGLKTRTQYNFTANAIDPDGDNISYFFDWGDGTNSGWTEFVPSGISVNRSHSWLIKRCYTVSVKAKDTYGAESSWGTLKVRVPKYQKNCQIIQQSINLLFPQIWRALVNHFPFLKQLFY